MLVLGLLSAALGASNVFTLPALVVDGGGVWARSDVCISDGMCLSDAGGSAATGAVQWRQDSALDLTPVDAGPVGITVAAVDAGAGTIDAAQYCIEGSMHPPACLTSWPASGSQQWIQDSALDYTPIDAGIGITVAAVDGGTIWGSSVSVGGQVGAPAVDGGFGVFSTLWSSLSLGTFGGFGSVDAGPTVVTTLNATTSSTSPLTLGAFGGFGALDAGPTVVTTLNASSITDTGVGNFGGQVGAPAVDGGFGVFSTLWSSLSLGTFGGFGSVDAGPTVVTTLNATTSSTSPLTLGAFGGFASVDGGFGVFSSANIGAVTASSITDTGVGNFGGQVGAPAVDGGFGVFSTLWSALSLGTFGGFGALDAGPTVVTTLNATTSSTSPLTLGAFGGFASVDGGFGVFSTLWSSLSLGTFGGFGSVDAGPTVVTTLHATTITTTGDVDVGSHLQSHQTLPTLTVTSTQGGIIPPDAGANGCTPGVNTLEATCIYGTDTSGIIVINLDGGLTPYVQELVGVLPSMAFPDGGWTVVLTKYRGGSTPLGSIGPSAAIAVACDGINFAVESLTGGWGITGQPNSFYPTTGLFNDGGKAACAIGYHVIGWSG